MEKTKRSVAVEAPVSLLGWTVIEEKKEHSQDRERIMFVIGAAAFALAIIFNTYVLAFTIALATIIFISLSRKDPEVTKFDITDKGIRFEETLTPYENIVSYNIVDDPGELARLILELKTSFNGKEVIPIYDESMKEIEKILESNGVEYNGNLSVSILDTLAKYI